MKEPKLIKILDATKLMGSNCIFVCKNDLLGISDDPFFREKIIYEAIYPQSLPLHDQWPHCSGTICEIYRKDEGKIDQDLYTVHGGSLYKIPNGPEHHPIKSRLV